MERGSNIMPVRVGDGMWDAVNRLCKRLGKTRSQVLRAGIAMYCAQHNEPIVPDQLLKRDESGVVRVAPPKSESRVWPFPDPSGVRSD